MPGDTGAADRRARVVEGTVITVMFTCKVCGVEKVKVSVPARESPGKDLMEWMDETMLECMAMHLAHSPLCSTKHLDLMIPLAGDAEWVGQQPPAAAPSS